MAALLKTAIFHVTSAQGWAKQIAYIASVNEEEAFPYLLYAPPAFIETLNLQANNMIVSSGLGYAKEAIGKCFRC